ncbi:MAG: porphobilinogen synthase [Deltaproteobacteria bacterium]|nr:porphobilinogen synthase [Deltaproteobacteria bacterium]
MLTPPARLPRRHRPRARLRTLTAEHTLAPTDLVWPVFVVEGDGIREEIPTLPGVARLSVDALAVDAREASALGIRALAIFPVVASGTKDARGSAALDAEGLACRAARAVRAAAPSLVLVGDIALDPYTSHGHDGVLTADARDVANDETVELLARMAVVHAQAGFDVVAPSDMMDGRVGAIRRALDDAGLEATAILSYAVKYASAFYGPFRDALGSAPSGAGPAGKRTYQMDPANRREALREVALDVEEGADLVMVKPAMGYLDVVRDLREAVTLPIVAYQVSGEYAMLRAGAETGALPWEEAVMESLVGIKRAGADAIFTYAAIDVARSLRRAGPPPSRDAR